jgi:peptidoglycan/xylan/chitin deacetylase (PgdA/CDA1 family)
MSSGAAIILMYHHIDEGWADPGYLKVSPSHFAEHVQVLREEWRPLDLAGLANGLSSGRLPARGVVVTFDDGYVNNLVNAKPVLERHDVPATVFVAGGPSDEGSEFWWDELERLLLAPGVLPETGELTLAGSSHPFDLGESAVYDELAYAEHRAWRAWEDPPTPRHALYCAWSKRLVEMSDVDQRRFMGQLRALVADAPAPRPTMARLSNSDLSALSQDGLITVGAHTMTHPALSTLPLHRQRLEVESNKAYLDFQLGHAVDSFAYPYGRYSPETPNVLRAAGLTTAFTTEGGAARAGADPLLLPRIPAFDLDGEEFTRWLHLVWTGLGIDE